MLNYKQSCKQDMLPTISKVVSKHKISARKSLGQHFLLDTNLTDRIARIANVRGKTVFEIGSGPGGLTRSLLMLGTKRLFAVEKDPACLHALMDLQKVYSSRLIVIDADAKKINFSNYSAKPCSIVANLPYNISTFLLVNWLQQIKSISGMTLTFQKEVADRLTAVPSTKDYGRLTVMTQWLCDVKTQFNISRKAFVPPPKVVSSVVNLVPRDTPLSPAKWSALEKVTFTAFSQRRKMLKSSLRKFNFDFESLDIDPTLRAENLSVEQFCLLARKISN